MSERISPVSTSEKLRLLCEAGYDPNETHPECYRGFSYVKFFELCGGHAQTPDLEATVSSIMRIRNGMILDGDAEALIRKEIANHAKRPARLTDRELYNNSCITRHQLKDWIDSDYKNHVAGLKHTIEFLLDKLDAVSDTSTDQQVNEIAARSPGVPKATIRKLLKACPKCNGEGFINRHANLPDEPCPACSVTSPDRKP
jgi:hypothetical protein